MQQSPVGEEQDKGLKRSSQGSKVPGNLGKHLPLLVSGVAEPAASQLDPPRLSASLRMC